MALGPRRVSQNPGPQTSKRRTRLMTTAFDAGEIDPRALHRTDTEIIRLACKRLRNWAIAAGGAVKRRPGTWHRVSGAANGIEADATRIDRIRLRGGLDRTLVYSPTQVNIIDESDWSEEDEVTSCPWAADDIATMQTAVLDDGSQMIVQVTSQSFFPRKVTCDLAGNWAITALGSTYPDYFDEKADGEILAPFRRLAPTGIDLTPAALTGSQTIELGPGAQSWFDATDHVNTIVRYHGRQMLVTAVTDADTATATPLSSKGLYPTHTLTVASTAAFAVGDPIEGDTTGVQATVAEIVNATTMDVIYEGYSAFDVATPERIVGPTGYTTASASVADSTEQASVQWDEALISAFAGYPGGCVLHKGRNFLLDLPLSSAWVAGSVVNAYFNHDPGSGELEDAVLDGLGENQSARIRYGVSAEQLILLTDQGAYFVGETSDLPIAQSTWNVGRISTEACGDCAPIYVDRNIIFAKGKHVHVVAPTGNVRGPWEVGEISELASHLLSDPTKLAFCEGIGDEISRYLFARNDDSTLAVFRHQRGSQLGGWAKWFTGTDEDTSAFVDIAARDDSLLALADLGTTRRLVEFGFDAILDGQLDYSTAATTYANETGLVLIKNNAKLYSGSINGSGKFVRSDTSAVIEPASGYYVGWDFTSELIPAAPTSVELGAAIVEIAAVRPRLIDTQSIKIGPRVWGASAEEDDLETFTSTGLYVGTVDPDDVLPVRSWTPEVTLADSGESSMFEPEIVFSQEDAAQCTIAAISWIVQYGVD